MAESFTTWLQRRFGKTLPQLSNDLPVSTAQAAGDAAAQAAAIAAAATDATTKANAAQAAAIASAAASLTTHTGNTSNPHTVTKTQVDLGNCDNTSDAAKPVSTATQTALDLKQNVITPGTFIADPTGAATDQDDEARAAIAAILDLLAAKGIMAGS